MPDETDLKSETVDQLNLDDVDIKVVQLLHKNGRMPFTEIAKKVGMAEATIRNRVQRLIASGAITIQAYLNPNKLGFRNIALIELKTANLGQAEVIASELVENDSVSYVAFVAGSYDLFIEVTYDTTDSMYNFLAALREKAGVSSCETAIVLKLLKTQYSFQAKSSP